jgi:hypothetical protein
MRRLVAPLALGLALAGCALGPHYQLSLINIYEPTRRI